MLLSDDQIERIAAIAFDCEPDWDAVYEGADHSWCTEASAAVLDYLRAEGFSCELVRGGFRGAAHAWIELAHGTVIDPTIAQYEEIAGLQLIGPREQVPFEYNADDERVCVAGPGHPFHSGYDRTAAWAQ